MERGARLILREELRVKLELYDKIIKRLQFDKMEVWHQQILNDKEIRRLELEGEQHGESDNQPHGGTQRD